MKAQLQNNEIKLTFPYDKAIIQYVRMLDSRRYVSSEKAWYIPLSVVNETTLKNLGKLGFDVSDSVREALKSRESVANELERISSQPDVSLDTSLPLYPFQRQAVAWMVKAGGGINAYPVGTGKTLMMIGTLEALRASRVLVIAPKSLLYQWEQEIAKWHPDWTTCVVDGTAGKRADQYSDYRRQTTPAILIVNYELALRDYKILKDMPKWDAIVCDEAHRLGNIRAKTRKAIKQFESVCRFGLTATPLMNHPAELYGIVDWCFPGVLGSYKYFLERYTLRNQWGGIMRAINLDELSSKVRRYIIRKELSQIAVQLPPLTIEDIPFDLSEKERELYEQIKMELLFDIDKSLIDKVESPVMIQQSLVKALRLMELTDSMELLGDDKTSTKLEILKERLEDVLAA